MKKTIILLLISISVIAGDGGGGGGGVFPTNDGKSINEIIKVTDFKNNSKLEMIGSRIIKAKINSHDEAKLVADTLIEKDLISNYTYNSILLNSDEIIDNLEKDEQATLLIDLLSKK